MRKTLPLCTLGALLLAATPLLTSAAGSMAARIAGEVARLSSRGETVTPQKEETEFGRRLLETWKAAGIELPMTEDQISQIRKGERRLSAKPEVELPANMRFTGFLQYSNVDGKIRLPYGFYTFSQTDGLHRRLYQDLPACLNAGGVYVGDKLYGSSNIVLPAENNPEYRMRFYQWDTDTWKLMEEPLENNYDLVSVGSDYDPVSGNVYGITFGEGGRTMLAIMDYENLTHVEVGDLYPACSSISAFAVNNEGTGYALDSNADLFKVDLTAAKATKIGTLDFNFYAALQSMTFDPRTGKLYLAASEGDPDFGEMYGRLCEVSLEDASTKLVGYFPEAEEYTVLHVVYDPEQDAPGAISDLSASYAASDGNASLTFTMPDSTFGGTTLNGSVDYSIFINDNRMPAATGTANAGEQVAVNLTVAEGRTKYVVVLSNTAGEGERNAIESWGGEDTPATVKAIAIADGNSVSLTWQPGGANNGYADLEGITYSIFRFPGPTMVAEGVTGNTYTDDVSGEPNGAFVYNIVPVRGGRYYQGLKTAPVYGGDARNLPYSQDFESDEANYDFLLLNNHEKGWEIASDWSLEGVMWYSASPYTDGDAWAIAPALAFKEGNTYLIDVEASRISWEYEELLGIGVGEGTDPSTYDTILDRHSVNAATFDETEKIHLVYECRKTGAYHVGLHALSPRNQSSIVIHAMSVEQGLSVKVPASVTELKATPGEGGDLMADISFKAPSLTVGDQPLESISKITLYREGTEGPVAELTDVVPGASCTITDEDAMNGALSYTVTAWNDFGEGATASVDVYVGIDLPCPPTGIKVADNLDGTYTLQWTESPVGINGGLVDLDEVTYNIYYYNDGSLTRLAGGIEGDSYTVTGLRTTGSQAFMFLSVSAVNDLGESQATEAPVITVGDPYRVPFTEGFANLEGIWLPEGETVRWSMYSGMSCDDDDSLMGAKAYDDNATGALRSGKFTFKGVSDPKVAFSFYGVPGIDNTLSLYASPEGREAERVLEIPFKTMEGPEGWRTCLVDFSKYAEAEYFSLIFKVSLNDEDYDFIYFDDINVRDVPEHNLEVTASPQNRATAGETARIDITLHNVGTSIEQDYKVDLYVDDTLVTTLDAKPIFPFERATLTYDHILSATSASTCHVRAELADATDRIESDNVSEKSIKVATPLFATPADLTVETNSGNVILNWNAPEDPASVTDSFEGYESFIYDGFSNWEVVDGDRMNTMSVLSNFYPGSGRPAAFFTVDFSSLGYDLTTHRDYSGHSGESFIACVRPTSLMSDDWIISPALTGEAQTVTLFAKSLGAIFSDSFEILYSEGGKDLDDFKATGTECEPGDTWDEYSADLPAGARYFAIHCNSLYGGMLMIDDVTFDAAGRELIGYKVYRDGKAVASVDASETSYFEPMQSGDTRYQVTALYAAGESAPCEKTITLSASHLNDASIEVSVVGGQLCVHGTAGQEVSVVTADGKVMFHGKVANTLNLPLPSGIYLVKAGAVATKVFMD